jgi:peptide deformylase
MKIKFRLFLYFILCSSLVVFAQCKKDGPSIIDTPIVDELAFTEAEKALILNNSSDSTMYVMNYFIHADSLILRKQSRNVNLNDTTTLFHLIDRMKVTVIAEGGVGIAAPQVGISRNIIWVQRYDKGTLSNHPWEVYLNPVITKYSDTTELRDDGCLSIPGISQKSLRAIWVDVAYDLTDGTHKTERIKQKYTAHIFQHEIDHLNGIVFLDRP